ncbi:hypothetical protein [Nocardia tengchongensis]|uniref:hypothetical protein n=1 Tax=Nocardia tengchongensis TaxID=2055889 RepID=UPI0036653186
MTSLLRPVGDKASTCENCPPRLNLAGWCIGCACRWCENPSCIAWYADSIWGPCNRCDGVGFRPDLTNCNCTSGLIEYDTRDEADQAWTRTDSVRSPLDDEDEYVVSPVDAAGL